MIIFLLSGHAESGKTTFFQHIKSIYPVRNVLRVSFGDAVKEAAKSLGWNGEKDEKGRSGLQMVGQGAREYFDKDIWVTKLLKRLDAISLFKDITNDIVIIDDCRYKNEVAAVEKWGKHNNVQVVKIRINRVNHESRLTIEQKNDSSERDLDAYSGWDYVITNWTLREYQQDIEKIVDKCLFGDDVHG